MDTISKPVEDLREELADSIIDLNLDALKARRHSSKDACTEPFSTLHLVLTLLELANEIYGGTAREILVVLESEVDYVCNNLLFRKFECRFVGGPRHGEVEPQIPHPGINDGFWVITEDGGEYLRVENRRYADSDYRWRPRC